MLLEKLVRLCLYNWLGYGNLDGQIWFIGTEEGGAEIWREGVKTQTLESGLQFRSKYNLAMDFRYVWEDLYKIPLDSFRGNCVWNYMAAFLLNLEGEKPNTYDIKDYVFVTKKLGKTNSNHFMCELLPLPKKTKNSIEDYNSIWKSKKCYHDELVPKRFEIIRKTIVDHNGVKLIVSYERLLTDEMLRYFSGTITHLHSWNYKNEHYALYRITIANDRTVLLLSTPFFGNGRISYDGLEQAASKITKYLC